MKSGIMLLLAFAAGCCAICLLAGIVLRPMAPLDSWGLWIVAMLFLICAAIRRGTAAILDVVEPLSLDPTKKPWSQRLTNWLPALRDEGDEEYEEFVRSMQQLEEAEQRPAMVERSRPAPPPRRRSS